MGKLVFPLEGIHFAYSQAKCQASWNINNQLQTLYTAHCKVGTMVENLPLWYHQFLTLTSTCCIPLDPGVDHLTHFVPIWFILLLWDQQLISIKYFPLELQLLPPSLLWRLFTISKMTWFEFLIFSSCSWCKISSHVGRHQKWDNIKSMNNIQDL